MSGREANLKPLGHAFKLVAAQGATMKQSTQETTRKGSELFSFTTPARTG
jgi:hypothetical protein